MLYNDFAVVVPMANEGPDFWPFIELLRRVLEPYEKWAVYLVVDSVSKDNTLDLCRELAGKDSRFHLIHAPENRNLVDAYLRGFREAWQRGHQIIIEMDAGLSHDPRAIPMFLRVLNEGNECAFGSRFIVGGSITDAPWNRRLLSRGGTILANLLLGTSMRDMTSGFQAFHAHIIEQLLAHKFRSTAHFYQTEVRYLLRRKRNAEVPIHYKAPSPRVSPKAIRNALATLAYYFRRRVCGQADAL